MRRLAASEHGEAMPKRAPLRTLKAAVPDLVVRPCIEADLDAVAQIYGHHVMHSPATFELEPPSRAEMARRFADIVGKGCPYLVATRGAEIVGYAYVGPYRPRPAYRNTAENSVYVRAGCERQGVGRALLAALLAECEGKGFRQVIAVIGDSANLASIRLHAAAGFRNVGTLRAVGFKFGRWLDSVLMQRDLGDGDRTLP
jgi:phosphinothricin acetyltransferase